MKVLIGLLTFVLILDVLLLMLLVLIQLPKKEAGMGTAFGGGATDALFGAGSGNALTKVTKYMAGLFLALSMFLSILIVGDAKQTGPSVSEKLKGKQGSSVTIPPIPQTGTSLEQTLPAVSNVTLSLIPTNALAAPSNAPPAPAPAK